MTLKIMTINLMVLFYNIITVVFNCSYHVFNNTLLCKDGDHIGD